MSVYSTPIWTKFLFLKQYFIRLNARKSMNRREPSSIDTGKVMGVRSLTIQTEGTNLHSVDDAGSPVSFIDATLSQRDELKADVTWDSTTFLFLRRCLLLVSHITMTGNKVYRLRNLGWAELITR